MAQENDLLSALELLEKSAEYLEWKSKEKAAFLAHFFVMDDAANKEEIQIGYYDEKRERMTTFILDGAKISMMPDLEVLKRDDTPLLPLDKNAVIFNTSQVFAMAESNRQEKYPKGAVLKRFYILQNLVIGQVYNVTFVTHDFKTINFKFDSKTGELKKHSMDSLLTISPSSKSFKPAKGEH